MPEKTARGGINACEPPFLRELKNQDVIYQEKVYSFDNKKNISSLARVSNVLKTAQSWKKLLSKESFDLIHLNTAFDKNAVLRDSFILSYLEKNKSKVFLKFHGSDENLLSTKSIAIKTAWRRVIEKSAAIGVLSSEEKENFVRAGVDEKKIFVVKNAVENPLNLPDKSFDHQTIRLLFVARLIKTKGIADVISACEILRKSNLNFRLDVLGGGDFFEEAQKLVKNLNLESFIALHNHVSEKTVAEFYQKSHLLVFPTYHQEGFPMVIFNAMANGLPIITTRIRAAADYLKEESNGLFCKEKDAKDVARKIEILINNRSTMKQMSEKNIALAQEFSPRQIAPEYLEIYRQIVNSSVKN